MNNDTQLPPITFSPEGPYRCGDTVTGTWTLRNWSDSANSDMKLRFLHAEGVQIIPERSRIPGVAQGELRAAFSADSEEGEGVRIGNLEPGERMVAVVAFKIGRVRAEDEVWMQAVVDVPTGERLLSQRAVVPVRLTARVSVPTPEIFKLMSDNQNFGMKMKIVNEGGIAERDVVVQIPIPDVLEVSDPMLPEGASVDFDDQKRTMRIKIDSIAAYQHEEIGLQFRASDALVGDLVEITDVVVTTPSSGSFHLEPIPARMERHVEFTRSAIMIEPGPYVESGAPVLVTVHVHNHGRSAARDIRVSVDLPEALIYASGSLAINGAHDARRDEIENIVLPLVRAHTTTPITFNATVRSPISNQQRYNIGARIDGVDIEPLEIAVESYPNFPVEENYVFVEGPQTVEPRAERDVVIKVTNTGTEVSRQVRVRIDAPEISINRASVEKDGKSESAGIIPIFRSGVPSSAIDLNEIGPQENRLVRLSITAPETFVHGTEFPLVCYVRHDGGDETVLDEITFVGRSFPHISANDSHIKSSRTGSLRVGQPRNISIYLKNDGSDVATKVRVSLDLPSSLKIENVSGAELNADGDILFHDIAAQASAEATVTLRMTGVGTGEGTLEIHPVVSGERMNTISLEPLVLQTSSQSFIDEVRVEVVPVEQDSSLVVRMTFRNIGDGEANNVVVRSTNLEGYAINTTTLDSSVIRDIKGQSPLAYGLNLPSIAPGSGVEVTYCVNPSDQAYTPEFVVETDDQPQITVKGEPYQARLKYLFMPQYLGADNNRSRLSGATETKALPAPAIDAIYREVDKPKANVVKEEPKKEDLKEDLPANQDNTEIKRVHIGKLQDSEAAADLVNAWNAGSQGTLETDHSEISSSSESADSSGESKGKNALDRLTEVSNEKAILDKKPVADATVDVVEVKAKVQYVPQQAETPAKELNQENKKEEQKQESADKPEVEEAPVKDETAHEQPVEHDEEHAQASTNHEVESAQVVAAAEALIEQPKPSRTLVIEDDEEDEEEIVLSPTSLLKQRTQVKDEPKEEEAVVRGPSRLRFRNRDEEKVTAPLIIAHYDKERIEQIRTAVDLLFRKEQIGCYRHVLAMRLFVGERIVGADAEINTAWDDLLRSTKNDLKTPLMRLIMPTFKPDEAWAALLGSPEALEATEMLMADMPKLIESNAVMALPELDDQDVYGSVQIGNFGYFERGEEASIAFVDAIIPEMIPTKSEKWPEFSKELKIYRDALAAHFKTTAYKSPMLRHEQMAKFPNAELDDALTAVILALESEMI